MSTVQEPASRSISAPRSQPAAFADVRPRTATRLFAVVIGILGLLHFVSQYLHFYSPIHSSLFRLVVNEFDLNREGNVSTWFASAMLLLASVLAAVVWRDARWKASRWTLHWFGIALCLLAFSCDETASLHEKLNGPIRTFFHTGSYFRFGWVIPGLVFLAFLAVSYQRFYSALPRNIRLLFGIAALVYFLGSLGFEMIGGKWTSLYGSDNFGYSMINGVEELLELSGVMLFIRCLHEYLVLDTAIPDA